MIIDALKNVFRTFISLLIVAVVLYGAVYFINHKKKQNNNDNVAVVIEDDSSDTDNSDEDTEDDGTDANDDVNGDNDSVIVPDNFQTVTYIPPRDIPNTNLAISRTGTVNLVNQTLVGPDISGNVEEVFVEIGQIITQGQPLFRIQKNNTIEQLLINLETAEKQLQSAYKNLDLVRASQSVSNQSYNLQMIAADMALQQAILNLNSSLDLNQRQLGLEDMTKDLQDLNNQIGASAPNINQIIGDLINEFSPIDLRTNQANTEYLANQAQRQSENLAYGQRQLQLAQNFYNNERNFMQIENAKLQIESTRAQIANQQIASEQNINQIQSQISQAEAQVKLAKLQLDLTTIKSPVSGKIMNIELEAGEKVTPSINYITIANAEEKEVLVNVSIEQALRLTQDQNVEITYAGSKYQGKIKEIGLIANPQTRLIPVKINRIQNSNGLIANSFLRVDFIPDNSRNEVIATQIPLRALKFDNNNYVANIWKNGQIIEKPVSIDGPIENGLVKIIDGLNEGDEIIVNKLISSVNSFNQNM